MQGLLGDYFTYVFLIFVYIFTEVTIHYTGCCIEIHKYVQNFSRQSSTVHIVSQNSAVVQVLLLHLVNLLTSNSLLKICRLCQSLSLIHI